jgi:GAF domain-containing protein
MQTPALPPDEAERLTALQALNILDTPPEARFDRITRLAARLFDVQIALVSLVDANRQWFKSCYGLEERETGRDISFCGHAILQPETMIVPDALVDPRFADNTLVTHEPHIRFYAGQPLNSSDGHRVGTLCIIDRRPRQLSDAEKQTLKDLAIWVERELSSVELTEALKQLQKANIRLARLSQVRGEFVHIVSHKFRTALTGIQGFSEMMRDESFSIAEIREYAADINEDAQRLNQMIAELLEVDRVAAQADSKAETSG